MVNEIGDSVVGTTGSGSGVTSNIDWTTYRFPQPIDFRVFPKNLVGEFLFLAGRKR